MPAITTSGNVLTKKPTKIEESNSVSFEYVINETTLLNKLKTVDGKGSGLDTDLVRGDYINPRMFKNRIINGDFSVWQRGEDFLFGTPDSWAAATQYNTNDIRIPTTANGYYYECITPGISGSTEPTWPTNVGDTVTDGDVTWECKGVQYNGGGYTADRYYSSIGNSAGGLFKVIKSAFSNKNSWKIDVISPPSDLTTNKYWYGFTYAFEGQQLYDLAINNKIVTISFWFKSNVTGKYPISLRNYTDNSQVQSYVTTFDYTTADTPQKVVVSIPLNASWTALNNDNLLGFIFCIGFLNQGDYATSTTDQWIDGNYLTTFDCVNWAAQADNYIEIAELQLEEGEVATEFEHVPYDIQLMRCMRYYEKDTRTCFLYPRQTQSDAPYRATVVTFQVPKRTKPSIKFGHIYYSPPTTDITDTVHIWMNDPDYSEKAFQIGVDNLPSDANNLTCFMLGWEASAEL